MVAGRFGDRREKMDLERRLEVKEVGEGCPFAGELRRCEILAFVMIYRREEGKEREQRREGRKRTDRSNPA